MLVRDLSVEVFPNLHYFIATCQLEEGCSEGDVRLAGGQTGLEGRVEICRDGAWRSLRLCGGSLGRNAATVVCRELGFSTEGMHHIIEHDGH